MAFVSVYWFVPTSFNSPMKMRNASKPTIVSQVSPTDDSTEMATRRSTRLIIRFGMRI